MAAQVNTPNVPGGELTAKAGAPPPSDTVEEEWDEENLEKAMKRLKEMHIQLRELRTTVPRMIAPLTKKQPSPEKMFREFSSSASQASSEMEQFRRLMTDSDSVKVLNQARKSRMGNPAGIKPWRVSEHPDWLIKDT